MTERDAIKILMLSPFYFKLTLMERSKLLIDFYANHQVNYLPSPGPQSAMASVKNKSDLNH